MQERKCQKAKQCENGILTHVGTFSHRIVYKLCLIEQLLLISVACGNGIDHRNYAIADAAAELRRLGVRLRRKHKDDCHPAQHEKACNLI